MTGYGVSCSVGDTNMNHTHVNIWVETKIRNKQDMSVVYPICHLGGCALQLNKGGIWPPKHWGHSQTYFVYGDNLNVKLKNSCDMKRAISIHVLV